MNSPAVNKPTPAEIITNTMKPTMQVAIALSVKKSSVA